MQVNLHFQVIKSRVSGQEPLFEFSGDSLLLQRILITAERFSSTDPARNRANLFRRISGSVYRDPTPMLYIPYAITPYMEGSLRGK